MGNILRETELVPKALRTGGIGGVEELWGRCEDCEEVE